MRIVLRFLVIFAVVLGLAVGVSLRVMEKIEQRWLQSDLARRSKLIFETSHDYLVDSVNERRMAAVTKLLNRMSRDERLTGAVLCSVDGTILGKSDSLPKNINCKDSGSKASAPDSVLIPFGELLLHEAVFPVTDGDRALAYLMLLHDTSYMSRRHETTRKYLVFLIIGLSAAFSILTLFVYRWTTSRSMGKLKSVFRGLISGEFTRFDEVLRQARVDRENFSVTFQGHVCYVKPFSINVEWPARYDIELSNFSKEIENVLSELNLPRDIKLGIGVDRVDYTKGIIERFRSVERLLDRHPELIGKFVFLQIGAPSRTHIKRYQDLNSEVQELADRINWKIHGAEVPPILLKLSHHNAPDLYRYYRAADLCFVSSLHDGMNLVAKEYISAHKDNKGVLVLSTFTGASRELTDAILVNPYDVDECATALYKALTMPVHECKQRMERLRSAVAEWNVYTWGCSLLAEIYRIAQSKNTLGSTGRAEPKI